MTASIIQFPGKRVAAQLPAPQNEKVRDDSVPTKKPPRRRSKAQSDGRRRNNPKSRSVEPNIQEIPGENGGCSYRVQIRKSVQGESVSFTKTFSKLAMARKWKKRKLAEIELDGIQTVSKKGDTVAAAITARLTKHKHLGRSARQQLDWLKNSDFGKKKLTELSLESLTDLADDMLAEERQPQTVAGYLAILVNTLHWASRRNFIIPVAALKEAMEHMWERKSAVDKIARTGIDRVVKELRKDHEVAMARHKSELADLGRGAAKPIAPVCPSFIVTEATIEGAFKTIASGCGFLGWYSDEAASFWGGHSMSKDQRAKTSGIVSKLWDGDWIVRPRVGQDGDGYVPPTPTTINLMFQPVLIRDTYGDEFLIGQGLLARMLPCWPESKMGSRRYRRPTEEEAAAANRFHDEVEAALRNTLEDSRALLRREMPVSPIACSLICPAMAFTSSALRPM